MTQTTGNSKTLLTGGGGGVLITSVLTSAWAMTYRSPSPKWKPHHYRRDTPQQQNSESEPDAVPTLRRSERVRKQTGSWWKSFVTTEKFEDDLPITPTNVPISYKSATTGPYASFWKSGIDAELDSLRRNKTWTLVPRSEASNVLTSKWVFKVKDVPGTRGQTIQNI